MMLCIAEDSARIFKKIWQLNLPFESSDRPGSDIKINKCFFNVKLF